MRISSGNIVYEIRVMTDRSLATRLSELRKEILADFFPGVVPEEDTPVCCDGLVLARFGAGQEMEATLLRWLQRILGGEPGFRVRMNNFGATPGESIHLRLQDQAAFEPLIGKLMPVDDYIRVNGFDPVSFERRPVIRVAAGGTGSFEMLLRGFAAREFSGFLEVRELVLYSQLPGEEKFRRCAVLPLNSLEEAVPVPQ